MAIKVKDLKIDTVYYDAVDNAIYIVEAIAPMFGDEALFMHIATEEGLRFSCSIAEATFVNLIELGEL
jgi:hypothetical protein